MKTTIEIEITTDKKPALREVNGKWIVTTDVPHTGFNPYSRALWVRTWNPEDLQTPKDGKGFLVTPRRKLIKG